MAPSILTAVLSTLALAPADATPAAWTVVHTTARGAPAVTASARSADNAARLVVRCDTTDAKIVSLQFIPRAGFAAATPRPVSINIDGEGWLGTNWQFPGSGAFVSDDLVVTNLTAMVARAKSIRIRATAPDNTVFEAVFAGPASDAPVRAVLAACGYEFGKVPPRSVPPPAAGPTPATPVDDE